MNIDLHCRLRAYAKLTVEQSGGGVGGDDFIKKILTTPKDTLIDLGYKDIATNKEVYALRRKFYFSAPSQTESLVQLSKCIGGLISVSGNVYANNQYESECVTFPSSSVNRSVRVNDGVYTFVARSNSSNITYGYDVFFVFTGTKEYLTYEDVGDVIIYNERFNLTTIGEATFFIYDDNGNRIESGEGVIESGKHYTIESVIPNTGYELNSVKLNSETISLPYTFICGGDVNIVAETDVPSEYYDYSTNTLNCSITLNDSYGNTVEEGVNALRGGEVYYAYLNIDVGYTFIRATMNGVSVAYNQFPYAYTCDGSLDIEVICMETDNKITLYNNSDYDVNKYSIMGFVEDTIKPGDSYSISSSGLFGFDPGEEKPVDCKFTGVYMTTLYEDEPLEIKYGSSQLDNLKLIYTPSDNQIWTASSMPLLSYGEITITNRDK